ncbi:MAG: hypothetical protein ACRD5G_12370 [Candidatus Acidiferrales bacterium]
MSQQGYLRRRGTRGVSILAVVAVILILGLALLFVAPFGFIYWSLNRTIRENPQLSTQPAPLASVGPITAKPTTLTCCGVEFDVPWGKPERTNATGSYQVYFYFAERVVSFKQPESVIAPFLWQEGQTAEQRDAMRQTFGYEAANTRYEAMEQTLRHVPKRVGLFNYMKLISEMMLVTHKDMVIGRESTGIFAFEHDARRGFQINDPAWSNEVRVILFDQQDRQIEFEVRRNRDAPALTQGEIDYVVRSIRVAPEEPPNQPNPRSRRPSLRSSSLRRSLPSRVPGRRLSPQGQIRETVLDRCGALTTGKQ